MAGRLEVITGGIFAGKSEELFRRIDRAKVAGVEVLLIKPQLDGEPEKEKIVTHYGREFEAECLKVSEEGITELEKVVGVKSLEDADIVAFDDGNFFSKDLTDLLLKLVAQDKRVMVAGLDLTFAGDPFHPMPRLMAESDRLDKLHAVCTECSDEASKSQLLFDGEPALADNQIIRVNKDGDYESEPRCRDCWEEPD